MLAPDRVKWRKQQKGKMRGVSKGGTSVSFGEFGLQAMTCGFVTARQIEAARTLGLSERQVLMLVRGPQAFRLALAPMTNDFVALLKDSSLVSVLTVLELTKQTQIFATNLGSWVIPGTLCAGLYLAMSLPLATLARRLEERWRVTPQ